MHKLNDIFDIKCNDPKDIIDITPLNRPILIEDSKDHLTADYNLIRNNIQSLLYTGSDALIEMLEIAKSSEAPRAFEVVGNLMKQLADINQQLLDLHNQKQKLDTVQQKDVTTQNITNNAVFVGSTTELSKYLNTINEKGLN